MSSGAVTIKTKNGVNIVHDASRGLRVLLVDVNGNPYSASGGGGGGGGTVDQGAAGADPWLVTGTVVVSALPAGLATSAKQDTGNASLASIDGKTPVLVAGAVPIVGVVSVSNFPATQSVSGPLTDTQLRASAVPVSGTFFQATQPVSAVALPLPAGASTEATLALIKAKTDNLDVALSTRAITGLTDAQLRAAAVPVSGTFFQATQPVSATSLPLPTGASTEATLALIKAKTDNLDVALSTRAITGLTDAQLRASAVPVSGTFFQATQPISAAALPLPTGAATETTLALIKAKTDNLDVALSTRAVTGLTDAQLRASAVPISAAALPLPTGASTEATLAAAKTDLDTLVTQGTVPSIGTRTTVAASTNDTLILAANAARKGAMVYNDSANATMRVALGTAAASVNDYTTQVGVGGYYEVPYGYTGQIRAIWTLAVGNARVTELT